MHCCVSSEGSSLSSVTKDCSKGTIRRLSLRLICDRYTGEKDGKDAAKIRVNKIDANAFRMTLVMSFV